MRRLTSPSLASFSGGVISKVGAVLRLAACAALVECDLDTACFGGSEAGAESLALPFRSCEGRQSMKKIESSCG